MTSFEFCKTYNKLYNKYKNIKFFADKDDVFDSVTIEIKCKEPLIVAQRIESEFYGKIKSFNIGVMKNKALFIFYDFSERNQLEIENYILEILNDLDFRYDIMKEFKKENKIMKKSIIESNFKSDIISFMDANNIKYTNVKLAKHDEEVWIYGNGGQIVITEWEWNSNEHDKDYADMIAYAVMNDNEIDNFYESKKKNKTMKKSRKENGTLFSPTTPYEIKVGNKNVPAKVDYEVAYDRIEGDEYVLGIEIKGVGKTQLKFDSKSEAKDLGWILESKKLYHKSLKEKRISTEDKIQALAEYKGVEIDEVEEGYDENHFEVDGEEWIVADYDTAYDLAVEYVEQSFDDMGLEAVSKSTQEYFLENEEYCSFPWKDDMEESNRMYCEDIMNESGSSGYASRLVEEAIDRKVIKEKDCFENEDGELDYEDTDELAEMLADDMDDDYDSMSEWFESIYGRGWAKEMKDTLENYLDYRAMAEYIVDSDGVANSLASWDGKEHTEKVNGVELYLYRTN